MTDDIELLTWKTIAYIGAVRRELDAIDAVKLCEEFPTLSSDAEKRKARETLFWCHESVERLDREITQMEKDA